MPRNGEVNREFGVYQNLCCGAEIVIAQGATFPICAMHASVPTEWKDMNRVDYISYVRDLDPEDRTQNNELVNSTLEKMNPRQWRLFLEEIQRTSIGHGLDLSEASDLDQLIRLLQHSADLSGPRSKREVEEIFNHFQEKIRRAA